MIHRVLHSLSTGSEQQSATPSWSVRAKLTAFSRQHFIYRSESSGKRNTSCFYESNTCKFFTLLAARELARRRYCVAPRSAHQQCSILAHPGPLVPTFPAPAHTASLQ